MSGDQDRDLAKSGCPQAAAANGHTPEAPNSPATTPAGATPEVPGPRPLPILGWRLHLARFFLDPLAGLADLHQRYGDVACLVRGGNGPLILAPGDEPSSTVFGFGPECNRQVLTQPNLFESDRLRAPKECPWLGEGMFAANGRDRSFQRRLTLTGLDRGLKIVTSMILQRYRLELIPKSRIDLKVTFILNFKNGLPVIVREQDREPHRSQAEIRGQLREMVAVS